jgi:hypothetical protein
MNEAIQIAGRLSVDLQQKRSSPFCAPRMPPRPERAPDREFLLAIDMTFKSAPQKAFIRPHVLKPLQGLLSKTFFQG